MPFLSGTYLAQSAEPIVATLGGGATLGTIFLCAWEFHKDEPQWDQAIAKGTVYGALIGAALLVADMTRVT